MRKKILSKLACPDCKSELKIEISRQSKSRIIKGKLICKNCNNVFEIIEEIVCFRKITEKDRDELVIKKTRELFLGQELKKEWFKYFSKPEFFAMKKEWAWMLEELNIKKSKVHLDWATGTGRFLRNILEVTNVELVALDFGYDTCLGLKYFLKKIKKYSKTTIVCGDVKNMPFSDNSFDSDSSWHGMDEPNINKAVDESKRVLKSGKTLAVSGIFFEKESKSLKLAKKFKIGFAKENEAKKFFEKSGFHNIKYKNFIKIKETSKENFLPKFGDYYTVYAISGKNKNKNNKKGQIDPFCFGFRDGKMGE